MRPGRAAPTQPRLLSVATSPALVAAATALVLAGAVAYHLAQGAADPGFPELVDLLAGRADPGARDVIVGSRLPRTSAGLLVGASLGMAGVLLQAASRNPLAEPTTTGVSAGGYLALVTATVVGFHPGGLARPGLVFVGGLLAAGLTYLVATGGTVSPTRVVLAGMTVTLALMSLVGVLLVLFEQETPGLFAWGSGTLVQNGYGRVGPAAGVAALAAVGVLALPRRLDVLGLGDETGSSLGMRPGLVRAAALGLAVVLTAAAVSVAGPLSFVGLVAPHLVRLMGVARHGWLLPLSGAWAAVVVLVTDGVAQQYGSTVLQTQLPVGVFTAMLGAPALILLARRLPVAGGGGDAAGGAVGAGVAGGSLGSGRLARTLGAVPYPLVVLAAVVVLATTMVVGLTVGDLDLSPTEVLRALVGSSSDDLTRSIVVDGRLPRMAVAALAGASLAASGALLQAVSRNPLADPSIVGVTGGAALGGLGLLLVFEDVSPSWLPLAAFVGGTAAVGVVLRASWRPGLGLNPERLLLVGVAMAAFTTAVASFLVVRSPLSLSEALSWLAGSTYARGWSTARWLVAWPALLLPVAWVAGRHLDLLGYGDQLAGGLGLRVERTRLLAVAVAVLLAAAAVSAVGTVGFVGLVAPHAARLLVGPRTRRVLVVGPLLGAALVALADTLGRTVLAPREVPSGLMVALVGAPYFVFLLWRTRSR